MPDGYHVASKHRSDHGARKLSNQQSLEQRDYDVPDFCADEQDGLGGGSGDLEIERCDLVTVSPGCVTYASVHDRRCATQGSSFEAATLLRLDDDTLQQCSQLRLRPYAVCTRITPVWPCAT